MVCILFSIISLPLLIFGVSFFGFGVGGWEHSRMRKISFSFIHMMFRPLFLIDELIKLKLQMMEAAKFITR